MSTVNDLKILLGVLKKVCLEFQSEIQDQSKDFLLKAFDPVHAPRFKHALKRNVRNQFVELKYQKYPKDKAEELKKNAKVRYEIKNLIDED